MGVLFFATFNTQGNEFVVCLLFFFFCLKMASAFGSVNLELWFHPLGLPLIENRISWARIHCLKLPKSPSHECFRVLTMKLLNESLFSEPKVRNYVSGEGKRVGSYILVTM